MSKLTKTFILILFFFNKINAQDYSFIGKKINYSDSYKKIKKVKNIDDALIAPTQVLYLSLTVDKDGLNYKKFIDNYEKFTNLKKLIIDNRWYQLNLTDVADISVFKDLEFLQVFSLPNLDFDKLGSLTNLKYLDLTGCNLKTFPASVLNLNQLEFLCVSLNYLSTLPNNISELKNLKEIDLTNNCFVEIPIQVSQLKELLYLDINNAEFAQKFNNGKLFCSNSLTVYPAFLSDNKKLIKVSLYKVNVDEKTKNKLRMDFKTIKFTF